MPGKSISFRQGASMLFHWTEGGFMVNLLEGPTLTENDNNREKTEPFHLSYLTCGIKIHEQKKDYTKKIEKRC